MGNIDSIPSRKTRATRAAERQGSTIRGPIDSSGSSDGESSSYKEAMATLYSSLTPTYSYPWPKGNSERLHALSEIKKTIFRGNTYAPVSRFVNGAAVLCISDRFWSLDMAFNYPNSEFHCIDFSNEDIEDPTPENCKVHDVAIGARLPFANAVFDHVMCRDLSLVIPTQEWANMMAEIRRVTKSGAYIELVDADSMFQRCGPTTESLIISAVFALRARGLTPSIGKNLKKMMEDEGFRDIVSYRAVLPLGEWSKDPEYKRIGQVWRENFIVLSKSAAPGFATQLGMSEEVMAERLKIMLAEFDQYRTYVNVYWEIGIKP